MALLYIQEYSEMPRINGQLTLMGKEPAVASQTVAIGGASVQSAPFNANTRFVRIQSDAICGYKFGANPTATTASRMIAGAAEYVGVNPGDKVAVITNT